MQIYIGVDRKDLEEVELTHCRKQKFSFLVGIFSSILIFNSDFAVSLLFFYAEEKYDQCLKISTKL